MMKLPNGDWIDPHAVVRIKKGPSSLEPDHPDCLLIWFVGTNPTVVGDALHVDTNDPEELAYAIAKQSSHFGV